MPQRVTFLEDQSVAVSVLPRVDVDSKPVIMVGVGNALNLYSETLDMMDTVSLGTKSKVIRISSISSGSAFVACADGSLGLQTITSSGQFGKLQQLASSHEQSRTVKFFDADLHRSGHHACILAEQQMALVDTQRDAVVGNIPLDRSGTCNGLRIVSTSIVAVGSAVMSLYDLRTPETKEGIPAQILDAPDSKGRIFSAVESDCLGSVMAGDSSGGLYVWDTRGTDLKPARSTHGHTGGVLGMSLGSGVLGSSAADGSVCLWNIAGDKVHAANPIKKRSRKLLADMPAGGPELRRTRAEGSGLPVAISIEDFVGGDVAYVTDTGVLALGSRLDWQ
jgi:hypothetical protein